MSCIARATPLTDQTFGLVTLVATSTPGRPRSSRAQVIAEPCDDETDALDGGAMACSRSSATTMSVDRAARSGSLRRRATLPLRMASVA